MNAVCALRAISALEGMSYLFLVLVAMPLKYVLEMPAAVKVSGAIHGWLFVLFVGALGWAMRRGGWSVLRALGLFALSLVPFGFLAIDRALRAQREGGMAPSEPSLTER